MRPNTPRKAKFGQVDEAGTQGLRTGASGQGGGVTPPFS